MDFFTKYNRKPSNGETLSSKSKVERSGYIPAKVQIENLLMAGVRLNDFRNNQYDMTDDIPNEDYFDPTRSPNFDFADATQLERQADEGISNSKKSAKANVKETVPETVSKEVLE